MRRLRLHLSIRSLLLWVALVGLMLGFLQLWRRSVDFRDRADLYAERKTLILYRNHPILEPGPETRLFSERIAERRRLYRSYYESLEHKYRRAARYPWLIVEPDPFKAPSL